MDDDLRQRCTGSDNPANRCGLHHCTDLAMMGGYSCCCGAYWTSKDACQLGAKTGDEVSLRERISELVWYATCQIDSPHDLALHVDALMAVRDTELETARASIARVREAHDVHSCERDGHIHRSTPNPCVNDGFCACGQRNLCPTLEALDPPEFELIELTHEEWETARDNDLAKLGCTLEALQEMARTGDYATPGHRALWLAIKPVPREDATP